MTTEHTKNEAMIRGVLNALRTFLEARDLDESPMNVHVGNRLLRVTTESAILIAENELQDLLKPQRVTQ